jgi:cysteine-rich repeat protein
MLRRRAILVAATLIGCGPTVSVGGGSSEGGSSDDHGTGSDGSTTNATTSTATGASEGTATADSSSTGPVAECGNGIVEAGEQCDGEPVAGQPCPAGCRFEPKTVLWELRVDQGGPQMPYRARSLAIAPDGEIYFAGATNDMRPLLGSVAADGKLEWLMTDDITEGTLVLEGVAADADAVFVNGRGHTATGQSLVTARFDRSGDPVWVDEAPAADSAWDIHPGDVALLDDGRVLSYGIEVRWSLEGPDPVPGHLLSYSRQGDVLEDLLLNEDLEAGSPQPILVPGVDGNDYVVGGAVWSPIQRDDAFVQGRGMDHTVQWTRTVDGPLHESDAYSDIAVDLEGSIIATGAFDQSQNRRGFWVHKYDATGALLWELTTEPSEEDDEEEGLGAAVDADGNIYVTLRVNEAAEPVDEALLLKLDPDGNEVWTDRWSPSNADASAPVDVELDPFGFVVVLIDTYNGPNDGLVVRKLAP